MFKYYEMIKRMLFFVFLFFNFSSFGTTPQENVECTDSLKNESVTKEKKSFSVAKYIVPTTFIAYGVAARFSKPLRNFDHHIHTEIKNNFSRKYTFDDYLQFASPVVMYGLNLSGVKSVHNLRDQTLILANAGFLTSITVFSVKYATKVPRPSSGTKTSFPSGHTAIAFAGAHILYREYKNMDRNRRLFIGNRRRFSAHDKPAPLV